MHLKSANWCVWVIAISIFEDFEQLFLITLVCSDAKAIELMPEKAY